MAITAETAHATSPPRSRVPWPVQPSQAVNWRGISGELGHWAPIRPFVNSRSHASNDKLASLDSYVSVGGSVHTGPKIQSCLLLVHRPWRPQSRRALGAVSVRCPPASGMHANAPLRSGHSPGNDIQPIPGRMRDSDESVLLAPEAREDYSRANDEWWRRRWGDGGACRLHGHIRSCWP